jgi:hypothetical protein
MTLFERVHLPSFAGATEWLNSEPLGPAELEGHVVLVNFWTLTCINWPHRPLGLQLGLVDGPGMASADRRGTLPVPVVVVT